MFNIIYTLLGLNELSSTEIKIRLMKFLKIALKIMHLILINGIFLERVLFSSFFDKNMCLICVGQVSFFINIHLINNIFIWNVQYSHERSMELLNLTDVTICGNRSQCVIYGKVVFFFAITWIQYDGKISEKSLRCLTDFDGWHVNSAKPVLLNMAKELLFLIRNIFTE